MHACVYRAGMEYSDGRYYRRVSKLSAGGHNTTDYRHRAKSPTRWPQRNSDNSSIADRPAKNNRISPGRVAARASRSGLWLVRPDRPAHLRVHVPLPWQPCHGKQASPGSYQLFHRSLHPPQILARIWPSISSPSLDSFPSYFLPQDRCGTYRFLQNKQFTEGSSSVSSDSIFR